MFDFGDLSDAESEEGVAGESPEEMQRKRKPDAAMQFRPGDVVKARFQPLVAALEGRLGWLVWVGFGLGWVGFGLVWNGLGWFGMGWVGWLVLYSVLCCFLYFSHMS